MALAVQTPAVDARLRQRYLIAIYSVVAFLAITLILIALLRGTQNDNLQAILLNLSATFAGTVLLFVVVDRVFMIDEISGRASGQQLIDSLRKLHDDLAPQLQSSCFNDVCQGAAPTVEEIRAAKTVDLCGVTLSSTIKRNTSTMFERCMDGAIFRILLLDHKIPANLDNAAKRSELASEEFYARALSGLEQDLTLLCDRLREKQATAPSGASSDGYLEVRALPILPSYAITSIDAAEQDGRVHIEVYPYRDSSKCPTFLLSSSGDDEWKQFFRLQFENLWETSRLVTTSRTSGAS